MKPHHKPYIVRLIANIGYPVMIIMGVTAWWITNSVALSIVASLLVGVAMLRISFLVGKRYSKELNRNSEEEQDQWP